MSFSESWFLPVVAILIAAVMHFINVSKMNNVYSAINGKLRTMGDLAKVREAINTSMVLAILYIILWAGFIITGFALIKFKGLSFKALCAHVFIFSVVTLIIGLLGMKNENRMKELEIATEDPVIEQKYYDYLDQWSRPQLKLKD